jgi:hypothetical protein
VIAPSRERSSSAGSRPTCSAPPWAAASGSDRQLRDVAGILAIGRDIDTAYIERWAEALGVADAWRSITEAIEREG